MSDILVKTNLNGSEAEVSFNGKTYNAVIGKNGAIPEEDKREGDWKTPVGGPYKILAIYFRPDKIFDLKSGINTIPIERDDIWVDEPESELYNQPAKLTPETEKLSHEKLWREDHLYDIFLDLDYNRQNPQKGRGSAIFMHVARDESEPKNTPTAGCIALKKEDLFEIVSGLDRESAVIIK